MLDQNPTLIVYIVIASLLTIMGLYAKLSPNSGRNKAAKKNQIASWVEKREKILAKKEGHDGFEIEDFLAIVLRAALSFDLSDKSESIGVDHLKKGVSVFEIGCYLVFNIDLWLFLNEPTLREAISNPLQASFVKLFAEVFEMDFRAVGKILNEHLALFGRLAREKADAESHSFYFEQLLAESKNNDIPKSHGNFEEWDSINLDFFENSRIQLHFLNFEKHMVPALHKSLRALCDMMRS